MMKSLSRTINQLSGGTFKKSDSQSWPRSRYPVSDGSESEAEPNQDRQHYRSEVETKAMSEGDSSDKNRTKQMVLNPAIMCIMFIIFTMLTCIIIFNMSIMSIMWLIYIMLVMHIMVIMHIMLIILLI